MAPQIITIGEATNNVYMQFGSFYLDDSQQMMKEGVEHATTVPTMILFKGANWRMKQSKLVRFITIGPIPVEIG